MDKLLLTNEMIEDANYIADSFNNVSRLNLINKTKQKKGWFSRLIKILKGVWECLDLDIASSKGRP